MSATQTVLILDDDPEVCAALTMALEADGRHLIVCRDIESAQIIVEQFPITHIITDIKLTGPFRFEGLDVIDLAKRNPQEVSVVVITGHDEPQTRTRCLTAGAAAYLRKPLEVEALLSAIYRAVGIQSC